MPRNFDPFNGSTFSKGSKNQSRHADKPQPLLQAQKVDRLEPIKTNGAVTYRVIEEDLPDIGKSKDRRRAPPRKRTRLRCGKILDQHGKFLIECQVHDRSIYGAHLRLVNTIALPHRIKFYDDEHRTLIEAEIIWRQKGEIGIQYLTALNAQTMRSGKRSALDSKYYAVN